TVGILSPLFTLPSHQIIMQGAHRVATSRGYHLLLTSPPPGADLAVALERAIRQFHVDGMLLIAELAHSSAPVRQMIGPLMPAVCADRSFPDVPSVYADNYRGGQLAAEHLWERGCRRPAVLALPKYPARRTAFTEFYREHGINDIDKRCVEITEFSEREGHDLTDHLLRLEPDGFFYGSDLLAIGGLHRLRTLGKTMPVIGYDNLCFAGPMGLTTVDQQYENMGRISFEMLVQQIEGHRSFYPDPSQIDNRVLTPQVIVRET
ncbi:MAG: substrate-binding domain-containing protein, partial [Phycisphaerae bacterium]|nr:substrate-binding domain-containing protein [Phycisphaerae bacterium]